MSNIIDIQKLMMISFILCKGYAAKNTLNLSKSSTFLTKNTKEILNNPQNFEDTKHNKMNCHLIKCHLSYSQLYEKHQDLQKENQSIRQENQKLLSLLREMFEVCEEMNDHTKSINNIEKINHQQSKIIEEMREKWCKNT